MRQELLKDLERKDGHGAFKSNNPDIMPERTDKIPISQLGQIVKYGRLNEQTCTELSAHQSVRYQQDVSGNRTTTTQDLNITSAVEQMPLRRVQITKLWLTITTDVEEKPKHNTFLV